jgi:lysophospholipase L1-like esterase
MDQNSRKKLNKIAIYGDSISTVNHGNGGYEGLLKASLKLEEIYNFSVGSSGLSTKTPNCMVNLLQDQNTIPKDVELILIWHGSNDWYWGTDIGKMGEKDQSTYWGGIDFVISQLRKTVSRARIAWVTPIFRKEVPYLGTESGEGYELKNLNGNTLLDYYETLERASKRYGFYLIDMRRRANIHRDNAEYYLEDNVHPNQKGYEMIHGILHRELMNIAH